MKKLFALVVLFLIAIPAIAFGVEVPNPAEDLSGFLVGILDAVGSSEWRIVGAFCLVGVVALVRRYGALLYDGLDSGKSAFIASLAIGAALALSGALASGEALGGTIGVLKVLVNGAITGLVASGLYSGTKKLMEPSEAELKQ